MNSDRGLSPINKIPFVTNVYKKLKDNKQFRSFGEFIHSKNKKRHSETKECVSENIQIHNLTPNSTSDSSKYTETTISTTSNDYDHLNMDKEYLDDNILDKLVKIEQERALDLQHITNMHQIYEIGNSTPSTEICKCSICSFYNGLTPPALTGIDPEMYPKCIYKKGGIRGIKRKIVGAKKSLYKYITKF